MAFVFKAERNIDRNEHQNPNLGPGVYTSHTENK